MLTRKNQSEQRFQLHIRRRWILAFVNARNTQFRWTHRLCRQVPLFANRLLPTGQNAQCDCRPLYRAPPHVACEPLRRYAREKSFWQHRNIRQMRHPLDLRPRFALLARYHRPLTRPRGGLLLPWNPWHQKCWPFVVLAQQHHCGWPRAVGCRRTSMRRSEPA